MNDELKIAVKKLIHSPELLYNISDEDLDALSLLISMHLQLKDSMFDDGHFSDRD